MSKRRFISTLTHLGQEKIAQAIVSGELVGITAMAVGDGGGQAQNGTDTAVGLVNEVYRSQLNSLTIVDAGKNVIQAEMIIPAQAGGFTIREAALFDDEGGCLVVAGIPETYKPLPEEGAGRHQVIRILLAVSSVAAVKLVNDPSVILATADSVLKAKNDAKDYADGVAGDLEASVKAAIADAITKAKRDFWEEENPVGTVRFFAQKADPNNLYPWSKWTYTGEDKSIRVAKADGSNVGTTGGSDTVKIQRENLPAVQVDVSGKAESASLTGKETKEAGAAAFKVYRFGNSGSENQVGKFSLDDVAMGDIPVAVDIPAHKHSFDLDVPERSVSGKTANLGEGKTISIVEAHTLLMCWARTA